MKSEILEEIKGVLNPFHGMLGDYDAHRSISHDEGFFKNIETRMGAVEKLLPSLRGDFETRTVDFKDDILKSLEQHKTASRAEYDHAIDRITSLEHSFGSGGADATGSGGDGKYDICLNRLNGLDTALNSLCKAVTVDRLGTKLDGCIRKSDETRTMLDAHVESLNKIADAQRESSGNLKRLGKEFSDLYGSVKTVNTTVSELSPIVKRFSVIVEQLNPLDLDARFSHMEQFATENVKKIEQKLAEMGKEIATKCSRYPLQVTTPHTVLTEHDPSATLVSAGLGGGGTTNDTASPVDVSSMASVTASVPLASLTDAGEDLPVPTPPPPPSHGDGSVTSYDYGSEEGREVLQDGLSETSDATSVGEVSGLEQRMKMKIVFLKQVVGDDRMRITLRQLSDSVLGSPYKPSDLTDDLLEQFYAKVVLPVKLAPIPFPATLSRGSEMDVCWFQGSPTRSLDSIICSFRVACSEADEDFMENTIWPLIVSQLLTYDADLDWVESVRCGDWESVSLET
jgi:hypothetical protein